MLKAAFGALLVAGAFGGALYAGGNVMGTWAPYDAAAQGDRPDAAGPQAKQTGPEPSRRRRSKPGQAGKPATAPRDALWIRRANAICRAARRQIAAMRRPRTLSELQAFLARGVKDNRRWNARFLALGAPRGAADRFRRLRSLFRDDEALLGELAAAIRDGDDVSLLLLGEELVDLARRESRLMVSLGARDCALPRGTAI